MGRQIQAMRATAATAARLQEIKARRIGSYRLVDAVASRERERESLSLSTWQGEEEVKPCACVQ